MDSSVAITHQQLIPEFPLTIARQLKWFLDFALAYYSKGDIGRAVYVLRIMYPADLNVDVDPPCAEGFLISGMEFIKKNMPDQAFGRFLEAIHLNPKLVGARYHIASYLLSINAFPMATKELQRIVQIAPDSQLDSTRLILISIASLANYRIGEMDLAVELMKKVVPLQKPADMFHEFGLIMLKNNSKANAILLFNAAIALSPDDNDKSMRLSLELELEGGVIDFVVAKLHAIILKNPKCEYAIEMLTNLSKQVIPIDTDLYSRPSSRNVPGEFGLPETLEVIDLVDVGISAGQYGGAQLVADKLGMKSHPTVAVHWPHGWLFNDDYLLSTRGSDSITLEGTERQVELLHKKGVKSAIAVGLTFCYCDPDPETKRMPGTLLVMPGHGQVHEFVEPPDEIAYLEYIKSISHNFSRVIFSQSMDMLAAGRWVDNLDKYGFDFVVGAHGRDRHGYLRMRKLFDTVEYMTSNSIGSHILYASFCGTKVSLAGPYFTKYKFYEEMYNYDLIKQKFPWFFVEPQNAEQCVEWAKKEIGFYNKVSFEELAHLFGWDEELHKQQIYSLPTSMRLAALRNLLRIKRLRKYNAQS